MTRRRMLLSMVTAAVAAVAGKVGLGAAGIGGDRRPGVVVMDAEEARRYMRDKVFRPYRWNSTGGPDMDCMSWIGWLENGRSECVAFVRGVVQIPFVGPDGRERVIRPKMGRDDIIFDLPVPVIVSPREPGMLRPSTYLTEVSLSGDLFVKLAGG